MGTLNITKDIFDHAKGYIGTLLQRGVPVADWDWNDMNEQMFYAIRKVVVSIIGSKASFSTSHQIDGSGELDNDFNIIGGDGTEVGAGISFVQGYPVILSEDSLYSEQQVTNGIITNIVTFTMTDTSQDFIEDELIGYRVVFDAGALVGNSYAIVANGTDSITTAENLAGLGAAAGDAYHIAPPALTTPGASRVDLVYLDVFERQVDSLEDPDLLDASWGEETTQRLQVKGVVLVQEGNLSLPDDGDGHYYYALGVLNRAASATITDAMVVDQRIQTSAFGEIKSDVAHGEGVFRDVYTEFLLTKDSGWNAIMGAGRSLVSGNIAEDVTGEFLVFDPPDEVYVGNWAAKTGYEEVTFGGSIPDTQTLDHDHLVDGTVHVTDESDVELTQGIDFTINRTTGEITAEVPGLASATVRCYYAWFGSRIDLVQISSMGIIEIKKGDNYDDQSEAEANFTEEDEDYLGLWGVLIEEFDEELEPGQFYDVRPWLVKMDPREGLILPLMTTAARDGLASPRVGTILFNTTQDRINVRADNGASPRWEYPDGSDAT